MKRLINSARFSTRNWLCVLIHVLLLQITFFRIDVISRLRGHFPLYEGMLSLCIMLATWCILSGTYWVIWSLFLDRRVTLRGFVVAVRQYVPTFLGVHLWLTVIGVVFIFATSALTLSVLHLTMAANPESRLLSLIILRGFSSFFIRCMEIYVLAWVFAGGLRLRDAFRQGVLSDNLLPWEKMPILLVIGFICGTQAVIAQLMLSWSGTFWTYVGISAGKNLLLGWLLTVTFVTACQTVSEASERMK